MRQSTQLAIAVVIEVSSHGHNEIGYERTGEESRRTRLWFVSGDADKRNAARIYGKEEISGVDIRKSGVGQALWLPERTQCSRLIKVMAALFSAAIE
jgi:hypothetical protein